MISVLSAFAINHPFSWYARVRDRKTGKEFTYWINGNFRDREQLAECVRRSYPGVELISADECKEHPTRTLQPIPPEHYEFGYREAVRKILTGEEDAERRQAAPIPLKPITLKPLTR